MRCIELSSPTRVARMSKLPKRLTVPEETSSPAALSTGRLSPVMTDWSTDVEPEGDDAVHRDGLAGQDTQHVPLADLLRRHYALALRGEHAGRAGRQLHKALYARARPRHSQVLQKRAELHDKRHLARSEDLAGYHGGDERKGDEHVRLYIKGRHQPDHGLLNIMGMPQSTIAT